MVIDNHYKYGNKLGNRDNPQPSSCIRYDKSMEKAQRLDVCRHERINHSQ